MDGIRFKRRLKASSIFTPILFSPRTIENSSFGTATVIEIDDHDITVDRPYGVTADFSMGRKVIPYVGIETYKLPLSSPVKYRLWQRKELK